MKNDTTFVRMRSGDHLGDAKMSKRAPRSVEFNCSPTIDRNGFAEWKKKVDLQKLSPIFKFLPRNLVMIFQSLLMILQRFFDFERP